MKSMIHKIPKILIVAAAAVGVGGAPCFADGPGVVTSYDVHPPHDSSTQNQGRNFQLAYPHGMLQFTGTAHGPARIVLNSRGETCELKMLNETPEQRSVGRSITLLQDQSTWTVESATNTRGVLEGHCTWIRKHGTESIDSPGKPHHFAVNNTSEFILKNFEIRLKVTCKGTRGILATEVQPFCANGQNNRDLQRLRAPMSLREIREAASAFDMGLTVAPVHTRTTSEIRGASDANGTE